MIPLILTRWLARLRSGKYKQGRGMLKIVRKDGEIGYCCLGLLCDIHRKMTGRGEWRPIPGSKPPRWRYAITTESGRMIDGHDAVLPPSVVTWAGLTQQAVVVGDVAASILNDGDKTVPRHVDPIKPLTFRQIANKIEEAANNGTLK